MSAERPLRVGINLLALVPGDVGGAEEYLCRLLDAVAPGLPLGLDITLYVSSGFPDAHPELAAIYRTHVARGSGRSRPRRILTESTWLARRTRVARLDVVHHGGGRLPAIRGAPAVLHLHDLQYLAMPLNFSTIKLAYLRWAVPRSVRRARLVLTPTEFVRSTVVHELGVAPQQVAVVPQPLASPVPAPEPADRQEARAAYAVPGPFVLYPAVTWPHKNHVTAVRALAGLQRDHPGLVLVLTGAPGAAEDEIMAEAERCGVAPYVRRTGRIPRRHLDALLAEAEALVFPSRYEGFGVPVLEAMRAGCPVVASDCTSLPEVVGSAGLLVDPDDDDAWVDAVRRVLDDDLLRAELMAAGARRVHDYSPARAATALAGAYRQAACR